MALASAPHATYPKRATSPVKIMAGATTAAEFEPLGFLMAGVFTGAGGTPVGDPEIVEVALS